VTDGAVHPDVAEVVCRLALVSGWLLLVLAIIDYDGLLHGQASNYAFE